MTFRSENASKCSKLADFKAFWNIFIKQLPGERPGAHSNRLSGSVCVCVCDCTKTKLMLLSEATAR